MNFITTLLLVYASCLCEEASVTVLEGATQAEVFNSIDNFSQYHSSKFRLNLFRSNSLKDSEGNQVVNYIFGLDNYSGNSYVFQVGSFVEPQIIEVHNKISSLQIELEHGHYGQRTVSLITVTKENIEMASNL